MVRFEVYILHALRVVVFYMVLGWARWGRGGRMM